MSMEWTAEQKSAINFQGPGELLVSAAAGSGKTAVLTERILQICLRDGLSPESLVVLTFTDKAAANMRQRLLQKLRDLRSELRQLILALEKGQVSPDQARARLRGWTLASESSPAEQAKHPGQIPAALSQNPDPPKTELAAALAAAQSLEKRLQTILDQVPLAAISTIHAFCLRLLQDQQDLLLDDQGQLVYPGPLRTIDAGEADQSLQEALDQVLTEIYQAGHSLTNPQVDPESRLTDPEAEAFFGRLQAWRQETSATILPGRDFYRNFLRSQNIAGRQSDDASFRERVIQDYRYLRALPDYRNWCQSALADLDREEEDFVGSSSCAYFLDRLVPWVDLAAGAQLDLENHYYYQDTVLNPKQKGKQLLDFLERYARLKDFLQTYRRLVPPGRQPSQLDRESKAELWDLAWTSGQELKNLQTIAKSKTDEGKMEFRALYYSNFGPLLQYLGGDLLDKEGRPKAVAKEFDLGHISAPFQFSLAQISSFYRGLKPVLEAYFALLMALDCAYEELKVSRGQIDFSDYEHLAYRLLQEEAVRDSLAPKYRAILIDEYQDTSPLQEALLQSLRQLLEARPEEALGPRSSLTMLGDIKQSIYRFRYADPDIFRSKLETFPLAPPSPERVSSPTRPASSESPASPPQNAGYLLLLNRNFRSQPALLEFINAFFFSFMRLATAEINYDASQQLIAGRTADSFPLRRGPAQAFNLIYVEKGTSRPRPGQLSARQLALCQAVFDLQARGYQLEDIAILARTHDLCQEAKEAMAYWQIESRLKEEAVFLQSDVQRLLTSLVQLLANFQQDIPLAAVLRSDLHDLAFREGDLYKISQQAVASTPNISGQTSEPVNGQAKGQTRGQVRKKAPFYARFLAYAEAGPDPELRARCQDFLDQYRAWRAQARYLSLADLLRRIVEGSPWLYRLASLPFAPDRLRDWDNFLSLAESFGRRQGHSLTAFAKHLEGMAQTKLDWEEVEDLPTDPHHIKILTLHAAKGLEFPVVIYYAANGQLRDREKNSPLAFLPDQGLAANYLWDETTELLSPRRLYFQELDRLRQRAENFRLLYVTMTRAQEVLYFTAADTVKAGEDLLAFLDKARASRTADGLADELVAQAKSDFDLLLASLSLRYPDLAGQLQDQLGQAEAGLDLPDSRLLFYQEDHLASSLADQAKPGPAASDLPASPVDTSMSAGLAPAPADQAKLGEATETSGLADKDQLPTPAPSKQLALSPFSLFPQTPEEEAQVLSLLCGDSLGPDLSQIPAKLTVSELKDQLGSELAEAEAGQARLVPSLREMALDLRRPDLARRGIEEAPGPLQLTASQYGSLLHQVLQRLRPQAFFQADGQLLPEADRVYAQYMDEEIKLHSLPGAARELILEAWPYVQAFLQSDLGHRLAQAEAADSFVARELPFTLSVPAAELAPDAGLAPDAISLVQGMIDLFFDEGDEVILVDYKSDRLKGSPADQDQELARRYQVQLDYYARALYQLRGRPVKAKIIWLIREGRAVYLT